ncbi:ExeM/NucH family extracellular endonuclease, partial [Nonlabens dokdonensis]|uniref:ExeM/NucH family extracellular endonuclease n=1 Tax=Nonlabens dokdonensis TaxID=328515 RepID=UPI0026F2E799
LVLVFHNGSDNASYAAYDLDGHTTNGEGYFVIGNAAVPNVSIVIPSNGLQNGPDAVALYTGNDTDFPNDTPVTTANLVDAIVYDTNDGDDAELLVLLNVGQAQVNEGGAGDKDAHSSQRIPNGAGGARNTTTYAQMEPTPGAINGAPAPVAEIIINEVDADTDGSDTMEFVELFDGGTGNTSLTGLVVVLFNGNSDTSYNAFDLDGFSTNGNGYFVLGNAAVPNVSLVISDNSIQNGPDAVAIYTGDDTDFPNGTPVTTDNLVDALVYDTNDADDAGLLVLLNGGQAQINEGGMGNNAGHSNQRIPNGAGGARNTDTYTQLEPTPGVENEIIIPIPSVKIHEVQGSGLVAAMAGLTVQVEAIVIGDFQNSDQFSGFFIQEEDADADADGTTSEGIFVYCDSCTTNVSVGDAVTVTGLAVDFFEMTQIDVTAPNGDIIVNSSGNTLPSSASITLPASSSTEAEGTFESVEGMLINVTTNLVVSEYFELARYGQLVLSANNRFQQFTDSNEPDVAGYNAYISQLDQSRIILDDDNNLQSDAVSGAPDEPYFWPRPGASNTNFIRGGDQISNLQGIMHWSFAGQSGTDAWRIRPVDEAFTYNFTPSNARTDAPTAVGGTFKIASFNVLNYFTTLDERGAHSNVELERQRAKIATAICSMDADIIGLIEIENNGMTALNDLLNGTNGINAICSSTYVAIDAGIIGTDEITVAFIYNTATVTPEGAFSILDSSVDPLFNDSKNRPVLAQTFTQISNGGTLTLAVNHLKSKGSSCDSIGDPDLGDGSANCNITRTNAATAIVNWLATDPTNSGDSDFMIIGDLNSYRNESPIDALKLGADGIGGTSDDFVDLLDFYLGDDAYSYVFDGQLGYLDYALASQSLVTQITGATAWHINSDEAAIFDYNDGVQDPGEASFHRKSNALPIYEANAYRASDHDPLVVGINLRIAPIIDCPDSIVVSNDIGICGAQVVFINATAIDPDGDLDTVIQTGGPNTGTVFPLGETIIQFTATDLAGNTSICTFTITVNDTEDPVSVCPADIIVSNDPGQCDAMVTFSTSATDNCDGVTSTTVPASGSIFSMGTTIVTVTSTDASGNTNVCTFNVTVNDDESPVVTCSEDITVSNDPGQCDAVVTFTPTATDSCSETTITSVPASGSAFPVGTTIVTVTATDVAGNIDVCTFDVTVNDTEAPELICPEDQTQFLEDGEILWEVPDFFANGEASATDNCTDSSMLFITQAPDPGTLLPEGVHIITIDAKDETGNFSTCTFELTIEAILGIDENELNLENIVLYPNPASDYVILNNPQALDLDTVEIYDIKGMLIQTMDLNTMGTEATIDVSRLASAIYMVVIKGENGYVIKHLIKR